VHRHDSLFFKYAKGLTTVLVAKDRVLGHNPVAALQLADSYYSRMWGRTSRRNRQRFLSPDGAAKNARRL